ncbi:MAG: hypothetical protein A3E24_11175 [Caulobacterales bacterium RIFCSPHIGHO2_12_FULL_68_13]|jgi:hypothetical protein|nr:MAG: hypothetical protein A3E24_11175 [Caulobacterales bacterium RIFCSPHIGHO2_12_FULL_68_13]
MGRLGVVKVMSLSSFALSRFALLEGGFVRPNRGRSSRRARGHGARKRYAGRLIEIRRMETRTVMMRAV